MAQTSGIELLAALTAFLCGCCLGIVLLGLRRQGQRRQRLQGAAGAGNGLVAQLLRNGVRGLGPLAHWMLRNEKLCRWCDDVVWWLSKRKCETNATAMLELLMLLSLLAFCFCWLVSSSPVFSAALVAGLWFGLSTLVHRSQRNETEATREAVPDALLAMGACFRSGYSLSQTFQQLAEEVNGPLKRAFAQAASDLATGMTAEEALANLRRNSAVSEMNFVAIALEIQHSAGGSMQAILDGARESVNTDLALRRSLQVQTAQARLSAQVVTCIPFALIAIISLVSKDFLAPFFSSFLGMCVLVIALVMQVAGVMIVRAMLKVDER